VTTEQKPDPYFREAYDAWCIADERTATDKALDLWRREPTRAHLAQAIDALRAEAHQLDLIEEDRSHRFQFAYEVDPEGVDEDFISQIEHEKEIRHGK
jgi:hypothetical protein